MIKPEDALVIGDSANDVLSAHGCSVASVAVTWGQSSTVEQLKKSEPSTIIEEPGSMDSIVISFEDGDLIYVQRKDPLRYRFLEPTSEEIVSEPIVEYHHITTYLPTGHQHFYDTLSNEILRFKEAKDFSFDEIKNGAVNRFFYNGRIQERNRYLDILEQFFKLLRKKIKSLNLQGQSYVIAAPNSAPEYCYKTDINNLIVGNLNRILFGVKRSKGRTVYRVFPRQASHLDGERTEEEHYKTMGILKTHDSFLKDLDKVIVFDDITTTKTQMRAIGNILRCLYRFEGRIYSCCLGKTSC